MHMDSSPYCKKNDFSLDIETLPLGILINRTNFLRGMYKWNVPNYDLFQVHQEVSKP